jgi:protein-disulfide isomerase
MKSRFSLILIACVLVFGAILFFGKEDAAAPTDENGNAVQASNHVKGEGKKQVVLTEYGDFECPACGQYYPIVEQVVEKYKADITFQFRHFPLRQIHPNAVLAHRYAEAASNQDKFWEMYNLLYQNQSTWTGSSSADATFRSLAESLNLDMGKLDADVKSEATNAVINADISEGQKAGVSSTPTFLVNGKKVENPTSLEDFNKLIDDAIAEQNKE